MTKKDKNTLIIVIIIGIISLPFIIGGVSKNCILKFDFSGKCFSENISAGIGKGFNIFVEYKQKQVEKKVESFEERLSNINTGSLSSSGLVK